MARVTIFVDGNDFYTGLKENNMDTSIDFFNLGRKLCNEDRELIRVYYYNVRCNQQENEIQYRLQQKFISALEKAHYVEPTFLQSKYDAKIKLAVDMLEFALRDTYDVAVLVSRSRSYIPAIKSVKDLGKHTELAFFNERIDALRNISDMYTEINKDVVDKCLYSSK